MFQLTVKTNAANASLSEEQLFALGASSVSSSYEQETLLHALFNSFEEANLANAKLFDASGRVTRLEENWQNKWLEAHNSAHISDKLFVKQRGSLAEAPASATYVVELDATDTFGLGSHPTSSLCALLLEELASTESAKSKYICELGVGSGILLIYAALLGFSKISGCEIDQTAAKRAQSNLDANGILSVNVEHASLATYLTNRKAEILIANIPIAIIEANSKIIEDSLDAGSLLLLSGFSHNRREEVLSYFTAAYSLVTARELEGWEAILLEKI